MWTYLGDSTVRLTRHLIVRVIPALIFYIGFTYCVGSLFRSGIVAALCSIGYVVCVTVTNLMLRFRIDPFYFDYLSPNPNKLGHYLHRYDSELFESHIANTNTNLGKAAVCVCILVGLGVIYSTIAYLRTRVRDK